MDTKIQQKIALYDTLSYPELARAMIDAKDKWQRAKDIATSLNDEYQFLTRQVIPIRMDRDQIRNISVKLDDGIVKRLQVNHKITVKTPPNNKEKLWEWLRDHDAAELITETVNSSTLSGYVGQQMKLGEPYPNDICDISIYDTASLVNV